MKIFADERIKGLFVKVIGLATVEIIGLGALFVVSFKYTVVYVVLLTVMVFGSILFELYRFIKKNIQIVERAGKVVEQFLAGDDSSRIKAEEEGELYLFFHKINRLMETSSAQIEIESQTKAYLRNTISDISHQLKTPLAALQIYNGILQEEPFDEEVLRRFTTLSEQELDRINTLVGNLLKITKFDAKTAPLCKKTENVEGLMLDIQHRFSFRAESEQKKLSFVGDQDILYECDRSWLTEALSNIVKNALDHTEAGDSITVEWKKLTQVIQITVRDTGSGIHPDDLYHIFKRFYRSRHSQDKQGIGLGLPLAKSIIEAHGGTIDVRSNLGEGSVFTMNFLIPTEL